MTIVSSGTLAVQDAGTNTSAIPYYLETNITPGSTSFSYRAGSKTVEGPETFYGIVTTVGGTLYGYKTAQTSNVPGGGRFGRGFDDTNFSNTNGVVRGSGSPFIDGWLGTNPYNEPGNVSWHTALGVVGVHLGSDSAALGSMTTSSFTGGDDNTYEIHHLGWMNNSAANYPDGSVLDTEAEGNFIMMTLKSSSATPPNTNDSFYSILINGQEYLRTDAHTETQNISSTYDSTTSSGTGYYREWIWYGSDVTDSDLTSIGQNTTSKTFKIKASGTAVSVNNGIAEEFGGNDSDDVKMSDYYKDGVYVSSSVTSTSIPTSGEIKVSDFYGSTYVPAPVVHHTTTFTPDYMVAQAYGLYIIYGGMALTGSGFQTDSASEFVDDDFDPATSTFLGHTTSDVEIQQCYTSWDDSSSSTIWELFKLNFKINGTSLSNSNTDVTDNFTKFQIWDGTDTSGTPLLEVNSADVDTESSSGGNSSVNVTMTWLPADVSTSNAKTFANQFGTSTTPSNNGTHTIKVIK